MTFKVPSFELLEMIRNGSTINWTLQDSSHYYISVDRVVSIDYKTITLEMRCERDDGDDYLHAVQIQMEEA